MGTKNVSEWTAMVTSIATAASITYRLMRSVATMMRVPPKLVSMDSGNRFGCAGWIAFCVTLARVNDAVAEAQTAAEIR